MSGRCRSCDAIMSEQDMKQKWPGSEEFSDLCGFCFDIAVDPDDAEFDSEFIEFDDNFHIEE